MGCEQDNSTDKQASGDHDTALRVLHGDLRKLEELVDIARTNGALGAKMTGGGLGGYMVALTPGTELQEKVASAMEAAGFEALRTKIGI